MTRMIEVRSEPDMQAFGERLGRLLQGGETVELIGDVGAGKTTMVRGIARGMGVNETVQSPSFTISRVYDASDARRLVHYDFYRLTDPGIMRDELHETLTDAKAVVVVEWADTVEQILPTDKLIITIQTTSEDERQLKLEAGGEKSKRLVEEVV